MSGPQERPVATPAEQGVRRAASHEAREAATALARAFFADPVFGWAVPDDDRRRHMLEPFFSLFVETLHVHDEIYTPVAGGGAALWVPPGEPPVPDEVGEDFGRRMEEISGPDAERMFEVNKVVDEHHPPGSYYFLQFMGVEPESQGRGIGSALMRPIIERCDRDQVWAYLDATSERNKRLYERHGFEATAEFGPAGGPPLFPMWREPGSRP